MNSEESFRHDVHILTLATLKRTDNETQEEYEERVLKVKEEAESILMRRLKPFEVIGVEIVPQVSDQ